MTGSRPRSAALTPRNGICDSRWYRYLASIALAAACAVAPVGAVTCNVPGDHATVQEAVFDPNCTSIALASQTFPESVQVSRSLSLAGPVDGDAAIEGRLQVDPGVQLDLSRVQIRNGCPDVAVRLSEGSTVTGSGTAVTWNDQLPCPDVVLFADGFETGDTSRWN